MHRPKFIVVGPQRAGTTWIYECLNAHPLVCTPKGVKETFFFDRYFDRETSWYLSHFQQCKSNQIACEVAPTYFNSEEAPSRIAEKYPECRIICTLRDPVSRIFSLYLHMRRYGITDLPFEEALSKNSHLLSSNQYCRHIRRWIDIFGEERTKILIFDDLIADRESYILEFYDFVGLPSIPVPGSATGKVNQADSPRYHWLAKQGQTIADRLRSIKAYWLINLCKKIGLKHLFFSGGRDNMPTLSPENKCWLRDYFKEEVTSLENLISRDLPHWKEE